METSKAINLSIQLSAVSYQPSAVSRQPSAVGLWPRYANSRQLRAHTT
ncbi:hypothetical protein BJP36_43560 [Moorena producens JHB]|uniref:Uncharacterized protein n=1 Tax=Moorena producens (strain JHB) TaxID=1454205 RepID=A0A9Q9UVW8_MOOP1|nr:hypothetical protein [Moorena producens]WAN69241.1 hypothetical protein BJP36_43560 [Moorena producens JHB]